MGNWMDTIGEARLSEGGIYVEPGAYVVEILKCKAGSGRKGDFFVVECLIHESNNPARPVGSTMDWFVDMRHEPSPGNIVAFVMAAMKCEKTEVTKEAVLIVTSERQPLKGLKMRMTAANIVTKEKKQNFTKVKWAALETVAPKAA